MQMSPHLRGSKPDVSDVVRDGLRSRHGTGQLPSLDDGSTALLHSLGGQGQLLSMPANPTGPHSPREEDQARRVPSSVNPNSMRGTILER